MKAMALLLTLTTATALAAPVSEPPDTSWHMLERQQDGGIASVLHGLSKHECEFAKARIEGTPATEVEKAAMAESAREQGIPMWQPYGGSDYSYYDGAWHPPRIVSTPPMDPPPGWSGDVGRHTITRMWDSGPQSPQAVVSAECFQ